MAEEQREVGGSQKAVKGTIAPMFDLLSKYAGKDDGATILPPFSVNRT